jgi:hypothetical protein
VRLDAAHVAPRRLHRHHDIAPIAHLRRASASFHPLLHARSGRHALDEVGVRAMFRTSGRRHIAGVAVKNLRITGSAVLLQTFSEVRSLHFRSTGVAV